MLISYARVSTPEQDLTQLEALRYAGCERTFSEKASGAKANRAGLAEALSHARAGDARVVWKLDRLGRAIKGLVDLAADPTDRGLELRSITDGDTGGIAGKLVVHILAATAEVERDLNLERTTAALIVARRERRVGGRKRVMMPKRLEQARKLLASGMAIREIAPAIGVSVPTL
jgi:DNA invertase Pin-like site-specific DNA recombinase